MSVKITHDDAGPIATVELMITRPLADYDLKDVAAPTPRDVDPILASQGFKDLLDEARSLLATELADSGLEIVQLTGAICHDHNAHRPGVWFVLREARAGEKEMTPAARARAAAAAEFLRRTLQLS